MTQYTFTRADGTQLGKQGVYVVAARYSCRLHARGRLIAHCSWLQTCQSSLPPRLLVVRLITSVSLDPDGFRSVSTSVVWESLDSRHGL